MSNIRTFLARRDTSERRPSSLEQTRKVQLALQSLNPSFTRQLHQQRHGLSHRSSVPCFFTSSTTSTKEPPRQRKVHRSPPPVLNVQDSAQRYPKAINSPTSPSATVVVAAPTTPDYLPVPSALLVEFPLSPLTPPPPSPATRMRRRFSLLSRKFGEAVPPELVFGADAIDIYGPKKACDGVQDHAFPSVAPDTNGGGDATCDLHISSTERRSEDEHPPPGHLMQGTEDRHTTQGKGNGTTWTLVKNGRHITQHDHAEMMELLRKL